MLKIEHTEVVGWEHAIRGMRNPMNSWEKSDSFITCYQKTKCHECADNQKCAYYFEDDGLPYKKDDFIGTNDLDLMTRLQNAGTDHRKFMRMIVVYLDITAPLYWWKEFDTYKVGTVANSCSTMHKIHEKEFTIDDFSCEHLLQSSPTEVELYSALVCAPTHDGKPQWTPMMHLLSNIAGLNYYREKYLETKDKKYWWQMIQLLPSSYNQKRTVMLNYEVLANIYKSRRNHKLDEWCLHDTPDEHKFRNKDFSSGNWGFCDWIKSLPYSELITGRGD